MDWSTETDVVRDGVRLHVRRAGTGRPLVLAHGLSDDGACWEPALALLPPGWQAVMPDARGHGLSDAPEDGYRLDELAWDLAAVCRALRLEHPVILGHSMGAATALALAGLEPDLPAAVVLEDPPPVWRHRGPSPADARQAAAVADGIAALQRLTPAQLRAEVAAEHPGWPAAELDPWVAAKQRFNPRALDLATPAHLAGIDLAATLARVRCPVTVIHGDVALGSLPSPDDLSILAQRVPHLVVRHVPGAGHNVRRDRPEAWRAEVAAALAGAG